jgi:hypothetical protein
LVGVFAGLIAIGVLTHRTGDFGGWLDAASGRIESADRGWGLLGRDTQQAAYDGDRAKYLSEVTAADSSAFRWSAPRPAWTDDGYTYLIVKLESAPTTIPQFILARGLAHRECLNGHLIGLGGYVGNGFYGGTKPKDCPAS